MMIIVSQYHTYQVLINLLCTALGDIVGYTFYMWEWEQCSALLTDEEI